MLDVGCFRGSGAGSQAAHSGGTGEKRPRPAGRRERLWVKSFGLINVIAALVLLSGCTPPGPRALLEGKRLIDAGQYPQAILKLKAASTLLGGTNAVAWNYLGLAYQHAGEVAEAEWAYQRALQVNHDLSEVYYNRGCLWLAQNKLEAAKGEFTAYTLHRPNAAEGFLKLGTTQLRAREPSAAEKSFNEALRLNPQNPEAMNGLGLAKLQRGRAAEAEQCFESALKHQPDYRPALLNLAIVAHQYLRDRPLALQKYREYLALKPAPANADALAATVRQLEQELNLPVLVRQPVTNALAPPKPPAIVPKPPATNGTRKVSAPKPESAATGAPGEGTRPTSKYAYKSPPPPSSGNEEDAERAFEQGLHAYQAHRLPEAMQAYRLAIQADPSLFEAHYNLGLVATEVGNLTLALTSYENALAIEPKSPEARLKSIDARYNFALVLKQANFPADAARELEKLLAAYPNETRAHLALANLYAQQLSKPAKAREQYLKVLEAEPQCSAGTAIRYWLRDHPP